MHSETATGLIDLLGDTRAAVVDRLRQGGAGAAEIAGSLGLSDVAVRRHLRILERDGLVQSRTERPSGRGRPGARYTLTARARKLFPDRSADLAGELLDWLQEAHGRSALREFLRWRTDRHEARYAAAVDGAGDDPEARAEALAAVLSEDGFLASTTGDLLPDGATELALTQGHCAIRDVAAAHPELCAYEAAMFQRVLGAPVSRRQTIAGGADACVCHISTAK